MNAPWKHQAREPFAAYLCDDASLDVLRPLVADMGWAPEKCQRGGQPGLQCGPPGRIQAGAFADEPVQRLVLQ